MNLSPYFVDLTPYTAAAAETTLGLVPLAVGWLRRGKPLTTGEAPAAFITRLACFCQPENSLDAFARPLPCPLENHPVDPLQSANRSSPLGYREVWVIGLEDIYVAPDLIFHFVTVHHYLPPRAFIAAVTDGPQPGSAELNALLRALRG